MEIFQSILKYFKISLFELGETQFSFLTLVYLIVISYLLIMVSSLLKRYIIYRLLSRSAIDIGVREAYGSIFRYLVLGIGFFVIFQTAGIDVSSLAILFGALGIGIGLGLQTITNNFVSGLIILLERPIKIRDRIDVAGVHGDVVEISLRATTILTNDNISIIVPNSEFISSTVINWSHLDRNIRFNFPVGVSYNEDPERIKAILMEIAQKNEGVLENPPPDVLFDSYGDSSLNFTLRVWTRKFINKPGVLKSQLYYEIFKKFKEYNVSIPFPQRDIHIKNNPDEHDPHEKKQD
ncbi:MAG: mechanosensitive ion channel family protein [bacterium]